MNYAGHKFKAPIPDGILSRDQLKFRNTILIAEHGSKIVSTERGKFRILRDGNHSRGALGNLVLTASFNPDYKKHGKGFVIVKFNEASPKEKSAVTRLMTKYGLDEPEIIVRLGLNKTGGIRYYSYFAFTERDMSTGMFNKYFTERFPFSDLPITSIENKRAIVSYGGYEGYYDFVLSVYNSWRDESV